MLSDEIGRQFQYLRLSITDVCNFKCNYCLPEGYDCDGERDFLSMPEFTTLVQAFAQLGMKKIRLTGGEPGLRRELTDIIHLCSRTEGIEQVALTTNGFNLETHIEQWVGAGLTALNVSVDSLDPRLFHAITGHQKLQSILRGLERAEQLGLKKIKLNAVLLKQFNYHQLDDYLAWIKTRNVTIRFIELMETLDNQTFFDENHISGEKIQQYLLQQGWNEVIKPPFSGPAVEFYHNDYVGRIGLIMPYSKDFCAQCNRLRMSATGKLHLCLFGEEGIDLRPQLRNGDLIGTSEAIEAALFDKNKAHQLSQRIVGQTRHLAMLGG
ncbi:GTP 3',8-cyclase MoaA [Shewanella surugensis]|uniref:GTP 3',8-cyclase n=1 Tax=Shewanella surugensis TaxID=212020 RepID=A0ABT0LBK1_9GAMM|nr:GTP 3',8-cyclase MoaA [Shewanella surugensis]MCL1125089.1 GTP 3',8-cyclase MoaA [Shewanella surugensis]